MIRSMNTCSPDPRPTASMLGRVTEALRPTTVVWAVDVEKDPESNAQVEQLIKGLTKDKRVVVEPVHILFPGGLPLLGRVLRKWTGDFVFRRADQIRSSQIARRSVRGPRILQNHEGSLTNGIDLLLQYVDQVGAELIVAKSRTRHPFVRMLGLGFSDELIERSKVPVILIGEDVNSENWRATLHLPWTNERELNHAQDIILRKSQTFALQADAFPTSAAQRAFAGRERTETFHLEAEEEGPLSSHSKVRLLRAHKQQTQSLLPAVSLQTPRSRQQDRAPYQKFHEGSSAE
jgi:hypothetical protein